VTSVRSSERNENGVLSRIFRLVVVFPVSVRAVRRKASVAVREAGRVHERVAALGERPAQDRLDHVRVEHVRRPPHQPRRRGLDRLARLDREPESEAARALAVANGGPHRAIAVRGDAAQADPDVRLAAESANPEALQLR
jgi:hypothetical protein